MAKSKTVPWGFIFSEGSRRGEQKIVGSPPFWINISKKNTHWVVADGGGGRKKGEIRISTCNVTGLYGKFWMRQLFKYCIKRGGEVWCITESHFDIDRQTEFENIFGQKFYISCQNREPKRRRFGERRCGVVGEKR